jgi:hypothetical protein
MIPLGALGVGFDRAKGARSSTLDDSTSENQVEEAKYIKMQKRRSVASSPSSWAIHRPRFSALHQLIRPSRGTR